MAVLVFVEVSGKLNSVSAIERSTLHSSSLSHLRSAVSIACEHALKDSSQCGFAIDRTSISIVCNSRLPYIASDPDRRLSTVRSTIDCTLIEIDRTSSRLSHFTFTFDHTVPALECTSAVNTNRPEAAKF